MAKYHPPASNDIFRQDRILGMIETTIYVLVVACSAHSRPSCPDSLADWERPSLIRALPLYYIPTTSSISFRSLPEVPCHTATTGS